MASLGGNGKAKNESYNEELSKLECPFTWNMGALNKAINPDYNPHDEEDCIPLLKLLRIIMEVFVDAKEDNTNSDAILANLKKCDADYKALSEIADPEISTKVVYSVLQATKCFVYQKLNMQKEFDLVFKNLEQIGNMSNKEKSTLLGCRSICWSKYHRAGSSEAEQFIREAIKLNGNCDVWHYILGKNIRRQRRDLFMEKQPGPEEATSFLKAYEISKNPTYGIFVAQMHRESRNFHKALAMYDAIFDQSFDSLSNTVLLRLALGFMNQRDRSRLRKAKLCLDKVEESCANLSMYLHYRGIYHMKNNQFAEAVVFFEKAMKDLNLPAEKQYLECMLKLQKDFDLTKYLVNMLDKYKSWPQKQLQSTILDVAFSYWKREHDLTQAIKYFLKAIEIDPQAKCLKYCQNNDAYPIKEKNVYVFLEKYIFPVILGQRRQFDEATIERVNAIKEIRSLNNEAQMNTLEDAFTRIKIKK